MLKELKERKKTLRKNLRKKATKTIRKKYNFSRPVFINFFKFN